MEWNWDPGNKTGHLCSTDFWQRCEENSMRKEWSFQQMLLEQVDIYKQKNEVGPFTSHHAQKLIQNKLKT